MGNGQSIEELQTSPELKEWCYEAVDTLINLDQKYGESIEEVGKKAEADTVRNLGSNVNNSMIIGGTSKVNITQKTVLESVVKTAYYVTSLNALKVKPEVKLIMCDIIGLTNPNSNEAPMPAYSDPKYLLRVLSITDVKEAKIENDSIIYTNNAGQSQTIPVEKVKEFIHAYYVATVKTKIETSAPALEQISTNINVAVQNVGSNEIKIKLRKSNNSTFNFNQSNQSKIQMDVEMKEIGKKLSDLRNRPAANTGDPNTGVPPSGELPPSGQTIQHNPQEVRNQSEEVTNTATKSEVKEHTDVKPPEKKPEEEDNTKVYIVIGCVVVGVIVIVIIMLMLKRNNRPQPNYMPMQQYPMQQYPMAMSPVYGGYVDIVNT